MMSPAEGIFRGAVSSINRVDDEVVWDETKQVSGVKKVKFCGEKLKSVVIDVENCLYSMWSPHHTETYLRMSSRGQIQRWKEHWRIYLLSPQNHEP